MTKLIQTRRRFLGSAVGASALLASPVYLRSSAAQSGGVVNIWTYDEFIPEDVKKDFEKETGIEVRIRLVDDQGKQFNLLVAEQPNPSVDIVTVAGHRFLQFIESGVLAPMDTNRLANWGNINPVYSESDWATINGNKWGAPILSGAEIMAFNTDFVPEDRRNTWDTLFSEDYSQQTAYIPSDMMSIIMLYLGYDGNMIEYMDDHDEAVRVTNLARDFLIEHKPLVRKYYDSGAEIQQMLVNQDVVLCHAWNGPISKLIMDGFPMGMSIPKEGSYGFVYTLNVANNAPNPDNAYKFLDAMLASPEIGAEMTKTTGFISTYKGSSAHLSDLEKAAASFPDEQLEHLQFFRAEAQGLQTELLDPAVEEIKAA